MNSFRDGLRDRLCTLEEVAEIVDAALLNSNLQTLDASKALAAVRQEISQLLEATSNAYWRPLS